MTTLGGGCHCGAVRFEIDASADVAATRCNCTICSMSGYLHLFVAKSNFRLLKGENVLTTYRFNTQMAQHHFCRICGVKSFYVPRSHPNGYSVNVNCLDDGAVRSLTITDFDGRHWEQSISELAPISD